MEREEYSITIAHLQQGAAAVWGYVVWSERSSRPLFRTFTRVLQRRGNMIIFASCFPSLLRTFIRVVQRHGDMPYGGGGAVDHCEAPRGSCPDPVVEPQEVVFDHPALPQNCRPA